MKKIGTLALAMALTGTLATGALATQPVLDAPNPNAPYSATLVVNGVTLETKGLPSSNKLPMRLLAESDHGYAGYYAEENQASFNLGSNLIQVSFSTGAVSINDKVLDGVTAEVKDGVTFLPVEVISGLEGYTVNTNAELSVNRIDITTPNNAPLVKLAYQIMDATEMGKGTKNTPEELKEYLKIRTENFEEIIAFSPMMINSDTIIIGKLAESGSMDQAKEDLKARQDAIIASFEQYLPGPLEMAKNGKIVESGKYIMLVISPDTAKATALFEEAVKGFTAE